MHTTTWPPGRGHHRTEVIIESWRGRLLRIVGVAAHVVVWAALMSVLMQLLYPAGRVLPSVQVSGQPVGMLNREALLARLDKMATNAELTVVTPAKTRTVKWATAGITIDRRATAAMVMDYDWWERLVPFSSLAWMLRDGFRPLIIVDEARLDAFARKIAAQDDRAVKEASITIKHGEVIVDPAKAGYTFTPEGIKLQLLAAQFSDGATVRLEPTVIPTRHSEREIRAVADDVRRLLHQDIVLRFNGHTLKPAPAGIGEWLAVNEDRQTKQLRPVVKPAALRDYLKKVNEKYADPPEPVYVTLKNGKVMKRTEAEPGLAMDIKAAATQIREAMLDGQPGVNLRVPVVDVPPPVLYHRTYTNDSAGLQALISHWANTTYGNYAVVVREIGGKHRVAKIDPGERFVTASTFKLYLTYAVFHKIEAGKLQPTDPSGRPGQTVKECVTEMIIYSTNPCAVALQQKIGQAEVNRLIHKAGFNETDYNNATGGQKWSTVSDEAEFLLKLHRGQLFNQKHTQRLLYLMKNQIWRGGIPAGVPADTVVANKVGFYAGWVHDVAIVYSPDATYILAIMSRGGSDPAFAELSRQVYSFFNR